MRTFIVMTILAASIVQADAQSLDLGGLIPGDAGRIVRGAEGVIGAVLAEQRRAEARRRAEAEERRRIARRAELSRTKAGRKILAREDAAARKEAARQRRALAALAGILLGGGGGGGGGGSGGSACGPSVGAAECDYARRNGGVQY